MDVYLPGETEPTDLIGYANYVLTCFAVDAPMQIPDLLLIDDPQGGRTEISRSHREPRQA